MADKPALFSGLMVRALLREIAEPGTGKTQTRRKTKCQDSSRICSNGKGLWLYPGKLPYSVGNRLWVREAWRSYHRYDAKPPRDLKPSSPIWYEAGEIGEDEISVMRGKLRPSMFMPRWASRITLEVTSVKVERLQDCSEADAKAEGIIGAGLIWGLGVDAPDPARAMSPVEAYARLWEYINGFGAWDKNPWVAAYTFRPILGNIDEIERVA